jgi:hypothetical protein
MHYKTTDNLQQFSYGFMLNLPFSYSDASGANVNADGDTWEIRIVKPDGRVVTKTSSLEFPEGNTSATISMLVAPYDLDVKGTYRYQVTKTSDGSRISAQVGTFEVNPSLPVGEFLEFPSISPNANYFPMFGALGEIVQSPLQYDSADGVLLLNGAPVGTGGGGGGGAVSAKQSMPIVCGSRFTPIPAGTNVMSMAVPFDFQLSGVMAYLTEPATSGTFIVDVNINGVSILSSKLRIDATEKTSRTAAVPVVISHSALQAGAEISIDIDNAANGTASGLIVTLIGSPSYIAPDTNPPSIPDFTLSVVDTNKIKVDWTASTDS